MVFPSSLRVISFLCLSPAVALAISLSLPGCEDKCGNALIPYPFGIGSKCSANSYFTIICQNSTDPPSPLLSSMNVEVVNISLYGTITVKQPVSPVNCSNVQTVGYLPISFKGTPFSISARYNSLAVLGCKNSVWLRADETTVGGCTAMCDSNSTDNACNGVNSCQTSIPTRLKEFEYTYKTTEATSNSSFCGYVFPVDKKWLKEDYKRYKGLFHDMSNPFNLKFEFAVLVLEWEFDELEGYRDGVCTYVKSICLTYSDDSPSRIVNVSSVCEPRQREDFCSKYPTHIDCRSLSGRKIVIHEHVNVHDTSFSNYDEYDYASATKSYSSTTKYCSCGHGYEGNPYLGDKGCVDIDEFGSPTLNGCTGYDTICHNTLGGFKCIHEKIEPTSVRIAGITVGCVVYTIFILVVACSSTKAIKRKIKANYRRKLFKRNGGLLLEKELSAADNGLMKTRLYSSKELAQATDHYNENRILGRGGQGTVYKGMLADGTIVAVKKSQKVEEGDLHVFINEMVILPQVNHRNVVKLLGCCLETEVPLLVYEFVSNGTLFHHIHEPNKEFPLTWEMRLRIAREIAGALAYLHSSASAPIYHRDIKSSNILLDDKYKDKVSDFGISRSIAIDKTHVTTRVIGTFGYFDPEYFQSSKFTDKSDVYSFGVVMVELLTGEKAVSSVRVQEGVGLAAHFLQSMEGNQLFDILDARVIKEGKTEEIAVIAELVRRCLHLNGRRRPTMKEVSVELEADQIGKVAAGSRFVQNHEDMIKECKAIEFEAADAESSDISSISGSINFDTIRPYSPEADRPLLHQPCMNNFV